MFLAPQVGSLVEPLTGRRWDPPAMRWQVAGRVSFYREQGLRSGDRVFIGFGNQLELFADLLALWTLGACAIPIDSRLTIFEIETLARAASPRFFLVIGEVDEALRKMLDGLGVTILDSGEAGEAGAASTLVPGALTLDQDALILFTSGTTGNPKGVVHTHRSLRARWMSLRHSLGVEKFRRSLCLLPTHFGHGLICNCLYPWLAGQDLYILPPFSPDVIMQLGSLVDEHGITFMSSVPSVWRLALKAARPPASGTLERVFCGSAPLTAHLWTQIRDWARTRDVCNSYGITETGSWVAGTTIGEFEPEDGLIGVPWGATIAVMKDDSPLRPPGIGDECPPGESGYVWLNTPALMKGYFEREDLTAQVVSQGWFMTGDLGFIDDRGYLYLRGRVREEVNKGGMKVYPADVESVVERFAAVADMCCFPYDDPLYGQNVGLALVMANAGDDTVRELHAWMKRHLAEHQMPARWHLMEAIPRTSRGKINRTKVAEACAALPPLDLRAVLRPAK